MRFHASFAANGCPNNAHEINRVTCASSSPLSSRNHLHEWMFKSMNGCSNPYIATCITLPSIIGFFSTTAISSQSAHSCNSVFCASSRWAISLRTAQAEHPHQSISQKVSTADISEASVHTATRTRLVTRIEAPTMFSLRHIAFHDGTLPQRVKNAHVNSPGRIP